MSQNIGTLITSSIRPSDSLDLIASAWSNEIKGGHHTYATILERNSIIEPRREWGMLCTIFNDSNINNNLTYQLKLGYVDIDINNNNNWVIFSTFGSSISTTNTTWLNSVISIIGNPPSSPLDGDRYLVDTLVTGIWSIDGARNKISQWNALLNKWEYYIPIEGDSVVVKNEKNCIFRYSGVYDLGAWVKQNFGGLSIKNYIANETIEVPTNYQYFVYGDLTIATGGHLINNGQVVTLNGDLIITGGGTFSNYGDYISPVATNLNTISGLVKFSQNINTVSGIPLTINHGLNSQDIVCSVYEGTNLISVQINIIDNNNIEVTTIGSSVSGRINIIS